MTRSEAKKQADALVARLDAGYWKPRVWQNLGWHYSAQRRVSNDWTENWGIYPSGSNGYWASLYIGGTQFHEHGPTPQAAFEAALAQAKRLALAIVKEVTRMNIVCLLNGSTAVRERSSDEVTVLQCGCAHDATHWLQGCKTDFAPDYALHVQAQENHRATTQVG